jgi:hypothetical protein
VIAAWQQSDEYGGGHEQDHNAGYQQEHLVLRIMPAASAVDLRGQP